jgi:hypothetical protein
MVENESQSWVRETSILTLQVDDDESHPSGYLNINGTSYGNKPGQMAKTSSVPKYIDVQVSEDVPNAPCFQTDDKGIVKNPNYRNSLRIKSGYYGFISKNGSVYGVNDPSEPARQSNPV